MAALIVAILGSSGLVGGIVALVKVRPESGRMIVEAAEGAVVVQSGVITALRDELADLRAALEDAREEEDDCKRRCQALEDELATVKTTLKRHGINGEPAKRPPMPPPSAA